MAERPGSISQSISCVWQQWKVIGLSPASGQRETWVARGHQIEHARVQVVIGQIVLAAESQGGVTVHAFDHRRRRLVRLWSVKASARWQARMPALSAAQQYGGDVNALRSWASFDAELQTFATGSLFCDIARQFSGERQVATDLANDQRSAQMASVNLDVTTGFLVDNPDRYQVFQSRRCEAATARRQRATPLTSVDKRGRNRVDCRFVGPFWRTVRASLDDDGDLQIEPKDKQTCVEYKLHKKRSGARTQRQRGTKARARFKEPAHLLTLQEAIKRDSQVQKKRNTRKRESSNRNSVGCVLVSE